MLQFADGAAEWFGHIRCAAGAEQSFEYLGAKFKTDI